MFNFFKKKEENNIEKAQNSGFGLLKNALASTANSLIDSVIGVVTGDSVPDEFELDDIESMLIKADLGVELATELVEKIKEKKVKSSQLKDFLKQEFIEILNLENDNKLKFNKEKLNVYFKYLETEVSYEYMVKHTFEYENRGDNNA